MTVRNHLRPACAMHERTLPCADCAAADEDTGLDLRERYGPRFEERSTADQARLLRVRENARVRRATAAPLPARPVARPLPRNR